jgi:hypothetical protein
MNKIAYTVAAATFVALLLIISVPAGMAAQQYGGQGAAVGTPQSPGGSFQQGAPSQTQQGFSPGSKQIGENTTGQGEQPPGAAVGKNFENTQGPSTGYTGYGQPAQRGSPAKGSVAGEAIVIGVDHPENCLRIRKGPSTSYEQIGCAKIGEKLRLTGVFSSDNRWAQLAGNGWVFACQIKTDVKPPNGSIACGGPSRGGGGGTSRAWSGPAGYYGGEDFGPTYYGGYGPSWYGYGWHHHHHHHHHPITMDHSSFGGGKRHR